MAVLSIVIPAYNEERFIGTLLDRIKALEAELLTARAALLSND